MDLNEAVSKKPVNLEEALRKCGFGMFNYIFISLAGGLMACAFLELTSINFVLSIAQCDLNMSTREKGFLSAIGYVGVILSSHLWGFLADTKGRRATLIPSLIIAFISTFMSSLANNFWLLLFLRFANGFFISCASSTTFAYLGEFHDNNKRAKVLMIASIIYSIFNVLLPTFAIVTLNQDWSFYVPLISVTYKPWRLFLLICGLPSLLCALVMIIFIPESPKFAYSQGDEPETLKILRRIYRLNYRKSILLYEVKSIVKDDEFNSRVQSRPKGFLNFMWSQSLPFLKGHHLRNIMTASFIQFSVCNAANGFWTFFPEFMNNISTWKESSRDSATICEIYNTLSVHNNQTENVLKCKQNHELSTYAHIYEVVIIYGICYLIMSLLINWTGKLYLIIAIVLPAGISALLLIFIKVPTFSTYLYLVLLLSGLTISVVNASTVELFPTKMRAMAVSISMMMGRLGSTTGSMVIGLVIDKHCSKTFLMPMFLLIISCLLAFTIPNINKRRN